MAIQINFLDDRTRIATEGAYARIENCTVSKKALTVNVFYYISEIAASEGARALRHIGYTFEDYDYTTMGNALEYAYNKLKTLPEFTDGVDV